jgi:hypothetical protein
MKLAVEAQMVRGSPWLTAIASLLARMSYVSCDMCRTSQPMMSGACTRTDGRTLDDGELARFQNSKNRAFFFQEKKKAEYL